MPSRQLTVEIITCTYQDIVLLRLRVKDGRERGVKIASCCCTRISTLECYITVHSATYCFLFFALCIEYFQRRRRDSVRGDCVASLCRRSSPPRQPFDICLT